MHECNPDDAEFVPIHGLVSGWCCIGALKEALIGRKGFKLDAASIVSVFHSERMGKENGRDDPACSAQCGGSNYSIKIDWNKASHTTKTLFCAPNQRDRLKTQ